EPNDRGIPFFRIHASIKGHSRGPTLASIGLHRCTMTFAADLFLDLLRTIVSPIGEAGIGPVIILAAAFILLLLLLLVLIAIISTQSRRLRQVSRHLRELSNVVQRQGRAIENLRPSRDVDPVPVPLVSAQVPIAEDRIPEMVESADGPVDLHE